MLIRLASCVGIFLAFAGWAAADVTPATALLVLNKADTSLAIVDPINLKVVGRVFAGQDPHEVIASADGRMAVISNYGGLGGGFHTLSVVDLIGQKQLPVVDLGGLRSPHGLSIADGKIYFTAESSKAIGRYDPATGKVDWVLGLGQDRTHMIVVSKDAKHIFTSNVNSNSIGILELGRSRGNGPPPLPTTNGIHGAPPSISGRGGPPVGGPPPGGGAPDWIETFIKVGDGPEGFDVSPDGKAIWAANSHDGTVSVIDIASKSVDETFEDGARMANRLKFTLDGKYVFISDLGGTSVIVFDVASRKKIKQIDLGHSTAGILMQPDGARAYIAGGSGVTLIDLKTLEVAGHIDTGENTDGMAWAVRNEQAP